MPGRAITVACPRCQMPLMLPESHVGQPTVCTRCQMQFVVTPTQAPSAATSQPAPQAVPRGPLPPHLQPRWKEEPSPVATPTEKSPETSEEATEESPRGLPWWLLGCGTLMLLLTLSGGAVLGFLIIVRNIDWSQNRSPPLSSEHEQPTGDPAMAFTAQNADGKWWDAKKSALTRAGVLVRIDEVEIGSVRHTSKGQNLETPSDNYLMITFVVKNKSRDEPVAYKSWYSYEYDEDGTEVAAELIDESGEKLDLFPIPGSERVERHSHSDMTLPKGDETYDTIVFKLSDDYADQRPRAMRLSLPAAAVEDKGFYQFRIPAEMIARR